LLQRILVEHLDFNRTRSDIGPITAILQPNSFLDFRSLLSGCFVSTTV